MARKLRIGVSVFFVLLAVALCVLWVRSYWFRDVIRWRTSGSTIIVLGSMNGRLIAYDYDVNIATQWEIKTTEIVNGEYFWADEVQYRGLLGFLVKDVNDSRLFGVPYWFFVSSAIVALAGMTSVATWRRPRFSLRTLLIATTLVAMVLGPIVLAAR